MNFTLEDRKRSKGSQIGSDKLPGRVGAPLGSSPRLSPGEPRLSTPNPSRVDKNSQKFSPPKFSPSKDVKSGLFVSPRPPEPLASGPPSTPTRSSPKRGILSSPPLADETVFVQDRPETADNSHLVAQQSYLAQKMNIAEQRQRGVHKRGFIGNQGYTRDPGPVINHKAFFKSLDAGTPVEHFTQLMIWCLFRRLAWLEKSETPEDATFESITVKSALEELINKLALGKFSLDWTKGSIFGASANLELAPNRLNEQNSRMIERLDQHLKDIQAEKETWRNMAKKYELPLPQVEPSKPGEVDVPLNAVLRDVEKVNVRDLETNILKLGSVISGAEVMAEHADEIVQETKQRVLER